VSPGTSTVTDRPFTVRWIAIIRLLLQGKTLFFIRQAGYRRLDEEGGQSVGLGYREVLRGNVARALVPAAPRFVSAFLG
jgi:hypothetical protein